VNLETIKEEPVSDVRSTPILFVHGMWHAAWCWSEHFLPYFARHGYVSHALSLRGHGGSEGWERLRWTSLAEYVSDVEQVVGHIGRPPVLVGHSMGGVIVQKYLESNGAPVAAHTDGEISAIDNKASSSLCFTVAPKGMGNLTRTTPFPGIWR
jgi:pimeloyl-ACP methyl ester carboxylesterase